MFGWFKKRAPKSAAPVGKNAPESEAATHSFDCVIGLCSDVGCVRQGNEDNAQAIVPEADDARAGSGVLVLVADGMGGHAGGEIASAMAAQIVCEKYYQSPGADSLAVSPALRAALEAANHEIYKASRGDKGKRGMGTTCTALVL